MWEHAAPRLRLVLGSLVVGGRLGQWCNRCHGLGRSVFSRASIIFTSFSLIFRSQIMSLWLHGGTDNDFVSVYIIISELAIFIGLH